MKVCRSYYEVMGVSATASPVEIRDKYHELARKFHPDRASRMPAAQRLFSQINMAYAVLRDPARRTWYDALLTQTAAAGETVMASDDASAANMHPIPSRNESEGGQQPSQALTSNVGGEPQAGTMQLRLAPGVSRPAESQPSQAISSADGVIAAEAAFMCGDASAAIELCLSALHLDASNREAHMLLGDSYKTQGRLDCALESYRAAAGAGERSVLLQQKIRRLEAQLAGSADKGAGSTVEESRSHAVLPAVMGFREGDPNTRSKNAMAHNREHANVTQIAVGLQKKGLFQRVIGR